MDTLLALILPPLLSPFLVILMRAFIRTAIPDSVVESAKIDGANDFLIYLRIVLPLSTAALATVGLFTALTYWNVREMATALIVTGPILLLYPFVQKYFVTGLTIGAMKG